ncbi:MAG: histone deacetylase [Deltaproteobacteria bacterium]|nr:histone deacetylase [Deltaproteobacteria bacterium]
MSVGLVYDERFLGHVAPPGHPERPARLEVCVRALKERGLWDRVVHVPSRSATREEALRVHDAAYLDELEALRGQRGYLDADTYFSAGTVEAAWHAAGSVVELVQAVRAGRLGRGVALVRPPGHHAERARAGGFCVLGNVAIAAAAAREAGDRVAVVDFDVHHGNGTQSAFYRDGRVLFVSLHEYGPGFYPGSGGAAERGEGAGLGATLNVPLPAGIEAADYLALVDGQVVPAVEAFRPDLLLVSAGFDGHVRDPLGGLCLDDDGLAAVCQRLDRLANALCGRRWVAVLEGGYHLEALATGVSRLVETMLSEASSLEGTSP